MALMFPRLAHNFAKNGYYPTDEVSMERILSMLEPSDDVQGIRIADVCAGEGVALAEVAHHLKSCNPEREVRSYGVEYDTERAKHATSLLDVCIQGDFFDTIISPGTFGLLFLNPPYGDLSREVCNQYGYDNIKRPRLEKTFYQKSVHLLQPDGIMVLIVPFTVLDDEFSSWISNHFDELSIFRAATDQFKQVVIMGRKIKSKDIHREQAKKNLHSLRSVGSGDIQAPVLPETPNMFYTVPASHTELKHFYRVTLEPEQLEQEIHALKGLWPEFTSKFNVSQIGFRQPACALSEWHLALALAAGAISGTVSSKEGKTYILKGDTHKEKATKVTFEEREDGSMAEVRTLTDKFIPVIRAWDMTPDSQTFGNVLTIR
ncbi:DUF6094 domain-containing protein [Zophobihabitans entericus]|uniref:Class I SAM-dependent methyltransferase n=1 Tax=Zophobihabitans entericus TaxID=1635327 RepID=A0A6G9ID39_9GAMM|nr:DUF6094 domain-containing protein [Zophobihabitans entericus]QIQ22151.1 class I SAM-dependent methyltransferase [Zophobihabitans entericus]